MSRELYAHQKEAFERFKDSSEVCLFFEMGCGKSATALKIAEHQFLCGKIDALLIIAPNDVHTQWANEQLPQWLEAPYQCQCLFGRGGQKKAYTFDKNDALQVVCVNIDTFSTVNKWKDVVLWGNSRKLCIILDEATAIKNAKAQRTQRLLYEFNNVLKRGKTIIKSEVKTACRMVLTGTPVTNGPMDLWSIMEFIRPNFFCRNWYSFQSYYGMFTQMSLGNRMINVALTEETWKNIKRIQEYDEARVIFGITQDTFNIIHAQESYQGPYKNADNLRERLKEVAMFKRLIDCVDMPEQQYITRSLSMSDEQCRLYKQMADTYMAEYKQHVASALNKITVMLRLQQISSGFVFDKDFKNASEWDLPEDIMPNEVQWIGKSNPKLDALYSDIQELTLPLIIITCFSAEAARIYDDLKDKYNCCLMTGWKRVGTVEGFKSGEHKIMIANSAVISKGFNLQNANKILFYSNTFSLETRLQTEGRIFRIGQKNTCMYIDYQYKDTVDERIVKSLQIKGNLLNYIREVDINEICKSAG